MSSLFSKLNDLMGYDEEESVSKPSSSLSSFRENVSTPEDDKPTKKSSSTDRIRKLSIFDSIMESSEKPIYGRPSINTYDESEPLIDDKVRGRLNRAFDTIDSDYIDTVLDDISEISLEEDMTLKNSLIGLGRTYNRMNKVDGETSEVNKAFAKSEKRLNELLEEIDKDKTLISKNLNKLSSSGRIINSKLYADLTSAKNQAMSTQLAVIKQCTDITKAKFDIAQKEKKMKSDEVVSGGSSFDGTTIRNLFSSRKDLISAAGGYGSISGSINGNNSISHTAYVENINSSDDIDDEIERMYNSNADIEDIKMDQDGDLFLKYESESVELVLIVNSSLQPLEVFARNGETNERLYDYPLPNDVNALSFEIDRTTNSATDNLCRNYVLEIE